MCKIKVIYEDIKYSSIGCFEDMVQQFINQKEIEVVNINYSHSEIPYDGSRHASTSFSAMIIYKKKE